MPGSELETKIEVLQDELDKQVEDRRENNGFLTKNGRVLDRAEFHAAVLGFTPVGIGYIMPAPLGEFFVIAELMMLRTGFNKKMRGEKVDGHLGDVMDEIAYTFGFSFLAVVLFELVRWQFGFGSLVSIDMSQLLVTMLGGA